MATARLPVLQKKTRHSARQCPARCPRVGACSPSHTSKAENNTYRGLPSEAAHEDQADDETRTKFSKVELVWKKKDTKD